MVTRKTEIGSLDGTPEKRVFLSIINDYDLKAALTELIDNAVDVWQANGVVYPLRVELCLDADRQLITLIDNAGGVRHSELRLLITPGGTKNLLDGHSIGIFGVGSKRAVVAIAEHVSIKTHHPDDHSYQIDVTKEWTETPDWEMPAYQIPDIPAGTTMIEFSHVRRRFTEPDIPDLMTHLGDTYAWFLQLGNCAIRVNGADVVPHDFETWAYPPGFGPRSAIFSVSPDGVGKVNVEITAGLIRDRIPDADNYGVYVYCNHRLIMKHVKTREVGYVGSEAGVPHPDASLCRAIVKLEGPAKLMPWNSSKTGINFDHPAYEQLRPTLIQLVSHYSKLSRRLKDDWDGKVFQYTEGQIEQVDAVESARGRRLILPALPEANRKRQVDYLKADNGAILKEQPWTLGLIEALVAVDIIQKQRLQTRNRIALILLDSTFEIALKEFIVHRTDLFNESQYNENRLRELFRNRNYVIDEVIRKAPLEAGLLNRARHYYMSRNKLIHERATVDVTEADVENYHEAIEELLARLFGLTFPER